MKHRKRFRRRPKPILDMALITLQQGEELICTTKTYKAIKDRVDAFSQSHQDRKIVTVPWGMVRKLKRVA